MERTTGRRIGIGLVAAAGLAVVAAGAYAAGTDDDDRGDGRVVGELVVDEDGERTVIVADKWRGDWDGPGFGIVIVPLLVVGGVLLWRSRNSRDAGPFGRHDAEWREWHRRVHSDDRALVGPSGPDPENTSPPAPPEP